MLIIQLAERLIVAVCAADCGSVGAAAILVVD